MTQTASQKPRIAGFLLVLFLFLLVWCSPAAADDAALLGQLPGPWVYTTVVDGDDAGDEPQAVELGTLTLNADGTASLCCTAPDGEVTRAFEGSWSFELVPDHVDRLTLTFTAADDPQHAGSEFSAAHVYDAYAESWVEDVTRFTYLILQEVSGSGVSPLDMMTGEEGGTALCRKEGPNMKVVKCKKNVSLRAKRSKTSACLVKVPLGASVFAFPEDTAENGFIWCVYQDEYGYILADYLAPLE